MDITIKIETDGDAEDLLALLQAVGVRANQLDVTYPGQATRAGRIVRATTKLYRAMDDAIVYSDESATRTTAWVSPLREAINGIRQALDRAPIEPSRLFRWSDV